MWNITYLEQWSDVKNKNAAFVVHQYLTDACSKAHYSITKLFYGMTSTLDKAPYDTTACFIIMLMSKIYGSLQFVVLIT